MKLLRLLFALVMVGAFSVPAVAQNHVIKLTPLKLLGPVRNLQLGYEGVVSEKVSLGVDVKIALPRTTDLSGSSLTSDDAGQDIGFEINNGVITFDEVSGESGILDEIRFSGISVTPQARFYLGAKEAPEGFYLNPWVRFFRYNSETEVTWVEPAGTSDIVSGFSYGGFGFGGSLGWQWFLGEHVVLDWNLGLGGLFARVGASGSVTGQLENDIQAAENRVNEWFLQNYDTDPQISFDSNSFDLKSTYFLLPVFRTNLSLGYAF